MTGILSCSFELLAVALTSVTRAFVSFYPRSLNECYFLYCYDIRLSALSISSPFNLISRFVFPNDRSDVRILIVDQSMATVVGYKSVN
jgi:hypothetical protein